MSRLSDAIPNRIRALRLERGWSMAELAERAGTTSSTIAKIEKSQRGLNMEWIERFAKAFGLKPVDLMTQMGSGGTPDVRMVPLVGDIAAGNWREAIESPQGEVPAVDGSENAFALRAKGDSMNLLIPDGGYVIIEPDEADLRDGRVYAIMNAEGETTLKRFRADPARLEPCSDNLSHETINLGRGAFSVVGRATGAFMPL